MDTHSINWENERKRESTLVSSQKAIWLIWLIVWFEGGWIWFPCLFLLLLVVLSKWEKYQRLVWRLLIPPINLSKICVCRPHSIGLIKIIMRVCAKNEEQKYIIRLDSIPNFNVLCIWYSSLVVLFAYYLSPSIFETSATFLLLFFYFHFHFHSFWLVSQRASLALSLSPKAKAIETI